MMKKQLDILGMVSKLYSLGMIRIFGNRVALRVNLIYFLYVFLVKIKNHLVDGGKLQITEACTLEASIIRENGYTKIDSPLPYVEVSCISQKVDQLFAQQHKTVKTLEEGGLLRLKSCLMEVPELERYILDPKIKQVLQGYFGCSYKVYSCDVYRTVPQAHENPELMFGSLKWHFDNCPEALLKVMVYLTDTNVDNGALTVVDKKKSGELKRRGFWDREKAHLYENEIETNALVLEGSAGTVLFFSVHHCIHKATLPRVGHRDVAVFLVQPAFTQQKTFTDAERMEFSYNYGYCVNPFIGKPLRYGYE